MAVARELCSKMLFSDYMTITSFSSDQEQQLGISSLTSSQQYTATDPPCGLHFFTLLSLILHNPLFSSLSSLDITMIYELFKMSTSSAAL